MFLSIIQNPQERINLYAFTQLIIEIFVLAYLHYLSFHLKYFLLI
jgi:hypothetical protein